MEFTSNADKYLFSREHFRAIAREKFLTAHKRIPQLYADINELVAHVTLFASGRDMTKIDNGLYIADLMVSFCRSHFIVSDLINQGELIEAATLIRKQMELLSRLNELTNGLGMEKLLNRTPNLKHLQTQLKRLYAAYSEIAHSSNPEILHLLGRKEMGEGYFTPLYPEFSDNVLISFQHLIGTALEFYVWCTDLYDQHFEDHEKAKLEETFIRAIESFIEIYEPNGI